MCSWSSYQVRCGGNFRWLQPPPSRLVDQVSRRLSREVATLAERFQEQRPVLGTSPKHTFIAGADINELCQQTWLMPNSAVCCQQNDLHRCLRLHARSLYGLVLVITCSCLFLLLPKSIDRLLVTSFHDTKNNTMAEVNHNGFYFGYVSFLALDVPALQTSSISPLPFCSPGTHDIQHGSMDEQHHFHPCVYGNQSISCT